MYFITKHHGYRLVRCWMYSVEWQKRGLPHAHNYISLVSWQNKAKWKSNKKISVEISDETVNQKLYSVMTKTRDTWTLRSFQQQLTPYGRRQVLQAILERPDCWNHHGKLRLPIVSSRQFSCERWPTGSCEDKTIRFWSRQSANIVQSFRSSHECNSVKSIKYICNNDKC